MKVDGFQGQEAEVVLFCCVRSALGGRIGFLSDLRRQNVALTRAKHSLVVFARVEALRDHADWKPFVDHLERKDMVLDTGHLSIQEVIHKQPSTCLCSIFPCLMLANYTYGCLFFLFIFQHRFKVVDSLEHVMAHDDQSLAKDRATYFKKVMSYFRCFTVK